MSVNEHHRNSASPALSVESAFVGQSPSLYGQAPSLPTCLETPSLNTAPATPDSIGESRVIPDEDPSRDVVWPEDEDEDNDEPEISGEGLGHEGSFEDENEEGPEAGLGGEGAAPSVKRNYPLPTWLKEDFEQRVAESKIWGRDGLPALYRDLGTFWFPRRSNFFIFKPSLAPLPSALYNYDMFLWDPEALLSHGLPCPNCKTRLYQHGTVTWSY